MAIKALFVYRGTPDIVLRNFLDEGYETIYEVSERGAKVRHLPNSIRSAMNKPNVTFQLYC